jgi:tight adherence protein C
LKDIIINIFIIIYFFFIVSIFYILVKKINLEKRLKKVDVSLKEETHKEISIHNINFKNINEKIFNKIGKIIYKIIPYAYLQKLISLFDYSGLGSLSFNIYSILGYKTVIGILFSIFFALIFSELILTIIGFLLGFVLGFFIPDLIIKNIIKKNNNKIEKELPYIADLIYVATLSGQSIYNSIKLIVDKYEGHIANELENYLKDLEIGIGKQESYSKLLKKNNPTSFKSFIFTLQQAENFGSSISEIIKQKADFIRFEIAQEIDKKTRLLSTKMLFPMIFLILPAFILLVGGPLFYLVTGNFSLS